METSFIAIANAIRMRVDGQLYMPMDVGLLVEISLAGTGELRKAGKGIE